MSLITPRSRGCSPRRSSHSRRWSAAPPSRTPPPHPDPACPRPCSEAGLSWKWKVIKAMHRYGYEETSKCSGLTGKQTLLFFKPLQKQL